MSSLDEFLTTIWSDTEGYVYLPTAQRDSNGLIIRGTWKRIFFEWPKHRKAIQNHISASAAQNLEVYFGPAIYKSIPTAGDHDSKAHILGSHVLWVDFDGNAPESWDNEPNTALSARPEDQIRTPMPTIRVQSSEETHQHVYWRLGKFLTDTAIIDEKNRALAYLLKADTSGWDANQILRPPESVNFKHSLPVGVVDNTGDVFPIERFNYLRPAADVIKHDNLVLDAVVDIEPIKTTYTWPSQFVTLFYSDKKDLKIDRSASLAQVAFFGAEIGMTDVEIFSLLVDCDNRWEKYVQRRPVQRQRLLSELVNRARIKHPIPLTDVLTDISIGAVPTEVNPEYVLDFRSFVNKEYVFDWLITDLVSRTGSAIVASAPGVGKTQFCIRLGMALSTGRKFLQWDIAQPARTLFISLEMGGPSLQRFMGQMASTESEKDMQALSENFFVAPLGQPVPIDNEAGLKFMEKLLAEFKPDLVIIDSFGQLFSGQLKDDDGVRKLHGSLARLRERYNCGMVFIHHNRKADANNKKPVELGDVFGSQYVTSLVDYVASLWKESDGIEYREVKNRLSEEKKPFKYVRSAGLNFEMSSVSVDQVGANWTEGEGSRNDNVGPDNAGPDRTVFGMG